MSPKKNNRVQFYAVATGRKIGIYVQWSSAQASVNRYPGACHKGFVKLQPTVDFLEFSGIDSHDINVYVNDDSTLTIIGQFQVTVFPLFCYVSLCNRGYIPLPEP